MSIGQNVSKLYTKVTPKKYMGWGGRVAPKVPDIMVSNSFLFSHI